MSIHQNKAEMIITLLKALDEITLDDPDTINLFAAYLYTPDPNIGSYLDKLRHYSGLTSPNKNELADAGNLLEQIAVLTFNGLQGVTSIKSFRSAGPQYDLLVSGDGLEWPYFTKLLYMQGVQRDIVIEAKCTKEKVSDQIFARLCSLMEINLFNCAGLGLFFTLNGATGFPDHEATTRQKKIGDARLRQVLFHARTGKSIIVFDKNDIFQLDKPATLIQLLIRKIRDIEQLSGLPTQSCDLPKEIDLPSHLGNIIGNTLDTR